MLLLQTVRFRRKTILPIILTRSLEEGALVVLRFIMSAIDNGHLSYLATSFEEFWAALLMNSKLDRVLTAEAIETAQRLARTTQSLSRVDPKSHRLVFREFEKPLKASLLLLSNHLTAVPASAEASHEGPALRFSQLSYDSEGEFLGHIMHNLRYNV
jgi:hypothetical protein